MVALKIAKCVYSTRLDSLKTHGNSMTTLVIGAGILANHSPKKGQKQKPDL